jgi:hypothetical protein
MRLMAWAGWLLVVAGCTTTGGVGERMLPAKVAAREVGSAERETGLENTDIVCRIQMIDGVRVSSGDRLKPGHRRLVVALGTQEGEFSGDVDLVIPTASDYVLKAESEDDTFTISLVEADTSHVVATSTVSPAPVMSFQVFVLQK